MYHLQDGMMQLNALRRKLGSVTQRVLTRQLCDLEEGGIISRTVFAQVPPRVDYALTTEGECLRPVITGCTIGDGRIARRQKLAAE